VLRNYGAFFFAASTVAGAICLDMIEAFCFPQLDETESPDIVCQQAVLCDSSATLCVTL
jgi:hypothetical protein